MSMPAVSTVGLQESARTSQVLAQQMDRISNFAFRQAEVQAEVRGREYGAMNAPTAQQLEDAISSGADVTTLLPGDQSTVFGRSARATALDSVTNQFEISARNSIVELQAAFENESIGLTDMQSALQALVSTQTDIVRRISPEAATKFSASIGALSNSAFLEAAKEQAKRNNADYEIQQRAAIDTIMRNAATIVKAGPREEGALSVNEQLNILRDRISSIAQELNDVEFYQTKIKEFDSAVSDAKISVVMSEALDNPARGMAAIRGRVKFLDEDVQATFEDMSLAEKQALYDRAQQALSSRRSEETAAEAAADRQRNKDTAAKEAELLQAIASNDLDAQASIMEDMYRLNTPVYNSYFKAMNIEGGYDDPNTVDALQYEALQGRLTVEDINSARSERRISSSTHKSLLEKVGNRRDESYAEAMRIVKGDLGLPDKPFANADIIDRGAQQLVAQVERELILARRADPSLDPVAFVLPKIRDIKNAEADAKARNRARTALTQAQRRFDPTGSKNMTPIALLEAARSASYPTDGAKQAAIQGLELYIRLEEEAQ